MPEGTTTLELDLIQTSAAALAVLFLGRILNRLIPPLRNYNIPEPVVGGLVFALVTSIIYSVTGYSLAFDMALKTPLMLVFFTTVGIGASLKLLVRGGPKVLLFLGVASLLLLVQNSAGVGMALLADVHPLQGLITGSITLSGGHGTGVTYADIFSSVNNMQGVMELAMASATFGLVLGGLIGGPVAKRLVDKYNLKSNVDNSEYRDHEVTYDPEDTDRVTPRVMMETLFIILLCMAFGGIIYEFLSDKGVTVPAFICALFLGLIFTNLMDFTGIYKINKEAVDQWGTMGLSVFLAMALMSLRLWELLNLAGPMLLILLVQTVTMALFAYFVTFRLMGKDYDAAIIASGHCGFGLGATPTAVANMEALVTRYGPSPQAFLVVPMVGAFFIDITNALVIQLYLALPFVS
ncbi:MAG: sodium/glutamate symporter [Deltaproteobacteria bacterium RIFOXYA12_FULL_58_15]|nr:MAG: sodium/glutamate symporter [Deltaproteobacteria bacterium RIFOXYA12_FULL_58_15]OGR13793.1 MAG: sodium/glutamate symporter [Deltaproteobacteria bacterium RIFOXYB12_FULL_58_9]